MSVTKLESLPNEILIDMFEKYLNGMDIINAFAFQLNRRFDAIVAQCRRVRFDFIRCHKDDFRFCIGLLPRYANKIEELALSEQRTPGQIHAFLSFYPSFTEFKQLRKLYFHISSQTVNPTLVRNALRSLSGTQLDTLSLQITKMSDFYGIDTIIVDIFSMKTLKKLILAWNFYPILWESVQSTSSNIEHLTIRNMPCFPDDLRYIFQSATGLKHLNIDLGRRVHRGYYEFALSSQKSPTEMPRLRTAVFNIYGNYSTTRTELEPCLQCMPSLHRLEIKAHVELDSFDAWETLLQTPLPSLAYFTFEIIVSNLTNYNMSSILRPIETPLWIEKENFSTIIKSVQWLNIDRLLPADLSPLNQYRMQAPVDQWWIAPQHRLNNTLPISNRISTLQVCVWSLFFLKNYYLNNVTHLVITEWKDHFFETIIKHIDCCRIKHLDISAIEEGNNKVFSLLLYTTNIISLGINLNRLSDHLFAYLKKCNCITFLDISADQHPFHTDNLSVIGKIFPNLEHLTINTEDLSNVPKLQTYLPRLRSLTFRVLGIEKSVFIHYYRRKSKFLFHRESDYLTVWIDQAALQDSYWQRPHATNITINNHSRNSTQQSWPNKIINKFSRLFRK